MVEMLVSHYFVATYYPCLPAIRIEARILLLVLYSALYPLCDAWWVAVGLDKAWNAVNT